jgi:hypothetical protein
MNLQDRPDLGERFELSDNAPSAHLPDVHAFPAPAYSYQDTIWHPPLATSYCDGPTGIPNTHLPYRIYGADWTNAAPGLMINQANSPSNHQNYYPLNHGFRPAHTHVFGFKLHRRRDLL